MIYKNRKEAGRILASELMKYKDKKVLVIALPRGGVPVGFEIAKMINGKLDVLVVRKIGTPRNPELAVGAIAPGGVWYLDKLMAQNLGITKEEIEKEAKEELLEIVRRQKTYRGDLPSPKIQGKVVILADDGVATGATMFTAIRALRKQKPKKLIIAVPVAPMEIADELKILADEFVCPEVIEKFSAVGAYYRNFEQVTDEEVRKLLRIKN